MNAKWLGRHAHRVEVPYGCHHVVCLRRQIAEVVPKGCRSPTELVLNVLLVPNRCIKSYSFSDSYRMRCIMFEFFRIRNTARESSEILETVGDMNMIDGYHMVNGTIERLYIYNC